MNWLHKHIDEISEVVSGGTPNTNNSKFWEGDVVWITPNDLNKLNTPFISDSERKITVEGLEFSSAKLFPSLSLIISTRAPIGYLAINKVTASTNQGCKTLVFKSEKSPLFFFYLIAKNLNLLLTLGNGTTFSEISKKDLCKIELYYPAKFEEQTAIARILSTVDKAIEDTEKLIAKYKRIKTGLMQDLLTKGIDENGNIRSEKTHKFKDSPLGRIPVEWEVVNLENKKYFELATGGTPSTAKNEYWENGTIPWLSSGEVHNKIIKNTAGKITQLGFENSNARFYPIGSVLIALAGQGKTRGTAAITEIETTSNQSIAAIIPDQELYNSYFLYHQLDFRYEELRSISSGSGRAGLSLRILKTIQVIYTDINEQKEIIKRLNQIDDFLNSNYKSLSKLSLLKSGLMQDLLTGKVRVPEELIEEINNTVNLNN